MRIFPYFALLVIGSSTAFAQTTRVDRIEIVNFGLYSGTLEKHEALPGTAAGINIEENRKLVEQTETVPGRIGGRFGIEYVLRGQPKGKVVKLTYITRFPPQGMVNDKGEKLEKSQFEWNGTIGTRAIRTYTFDNSWEIVPGDWTLEFYYQGRKIGEKRFTVVLP